MCIRCIVQVKINFKYDIECFLFCYLNGICTVLFVVCWETVVEQREAPWLVTGVYKGHTQIDLCIYQVSSVFFNAT